jgi:hypothetical protein
MRKQVKLGLESLFFGLLLVGLGIGLLVYLDSISYEEEGKCYDKYKNEILGQTCLIDTISGEVSYGLIESFGILLSILGVPGVFIGIMMLAIPRLGGSDE